VAREYHNLAGLIRDLKGARQSAKGEALAEELGELLGDLLQLEDDDAVGGTSSDHGLEDGEPGEPDGGDEVTPGWSTGASQLLLAGPEPASSPPGGVAPRLPARGEHGRVPRAQPVAGDGPEDRLTGRRVLERRTRGTY